MRMNYPDPFNLTVNQVGCLPTVVDIFRMIVILERIVLIFDLIFYVSLECVKGSGGFTCSKFVSMN